MPEEIFEEIREVVASLARIADIRQRGYALASRLQARDTGFVLECLKVIRERACEGDEDFLCLYNGLLVNDTLVAVLGRATVAELVDAAQSRGDFEVVALLLDLPSRHAQSADPPYIDPTLRDVPLGMRKSLAKITEPRLMQRVARDQDHRVIRTLLWNPRLTEADVMRIGATRPTSPKVLQEIYNHPKWISRYRIKKVIVFNPCSPVSLSLRLLTYLSVQDLEFVCQSNELDPALISQAERLMEKKGGSSTTEYSLDVD